MSWDLWRGRISAGPCRLLGRTNGRWVKQAWRWSKSVLAGVRPLSAATIPSSVDWKVPSIAFPMWLMAAWTCGGGADVPAVTGEAIVMTVTAEAGREDSGSGLSMEYFERS